MPHTDENSDVNFMKRMNLIKSIPIVGPIFCLGAASAAFLDKDYEKAKTLASFDFANLNPLKAGTTLTKNIVASFCDLKKGVWIGKRALKRTKVIGFSFTPGYDMHHWAIMIDGIIYHVRRYSKDDVGVDVTSGDCIINTFEWTPTKYRRHNKSVADLIDFSAKYIKKFGFNTNDRNCQHFVRDMLAYVSDTDVETAGFLILFIYCGTSLF